MATETETRRELHRIATHVLARRRYQISGRFGLRASPGGVATPAFGDEPEVIRTAGMTLGREVGGASRYTPIRGATLRQLAAFAGTDVDAPFSAGADTPPVGDPDTPLDLDAAWVAVLADWYATGWRALDQVLATVAPGGEPATVQLWPEHFDAGTYVGLPSGERVDLGFSPGDQLESGPYVYVGPWSSDRHGDPDFWNAPFGALLRMSELAPGADRVAACVEFLRAGMANASAE